MSESTSPNPYVAIPIGVEPKPAQTRPATAAKQPRLWPGAIIVSLIWILAIVPGWLAPGTMMQFMVMFFSPMVLTLVFALWWLFASRVPWADRALGLVAFIGIGTAAFFTWHSTVGVFGLILSALPAVLTAWIVWLYAALFFPSRLVRLVGLVWVFALGFGYFSLVRMDGVDGSFKADMRWRWSQTAEEKFLAENKAGGAAQAEPPAPTSEPLVLAADDWPCFRGPERDGRRTGERIATDWKANPPREIWKKCVGPGWSSFTVVGNRLFTQEQRGEFEFVVCYDAATGKELWLHQDQARFSEPVGGPGPRATPTFHEGKLYALGAAGRLNCLDPLTGKPHWSRDIAADSGAEVPTWGFAASPLIVQDIVTVFAGGPKKGVLGYRADDGELAWSAGDKGYSYCSLHLAKLSGVEQLVITTDAGLTSYEPARGKLLWQHDWPLDEGMARVTQPALVDDSDVLIGTGFGNGTRRVHVARDKDAWTTEEVWTTKAIKPYFNDLIVHGEHLYGFDNNLFTCVSLADGKLKWRTRGYGNGQVLLLVDQGLLLVLSETGDVALLEATPEKHKELGRFKALEGKTWNHPVVVRGRLYVRNGEEAACFEVGER